MKTTNARSFSASVKEELIRMPAGRACCMLSEISALTQTSGHLSFRGGGWISASWRVDNAGTARRLFQLLKKRLNVTPSLHFIQTKQLGGRRTCVLTLGTEDTRTLLNALHMAETDEEGHIHLKRTVPRHPLTRQCCGRAFLRGAFLGAGTVTNPEKGYHLEWKTDDDRLARTLEKLLEKNGLPFRSYSRRGQQVIYLKDAQQISDTLAMMGAGSGVLEMENIRIRKQLRAQATRAANCDEHNGERMLDAAQKQAEAIRKIALKEGLFTLPRKLEELARLRIENPDLSLKELGEMTDPPIGKSGVNHRMRQLMAIAEGLGEKD
jgi:DNA-binding protein WhiA